MEEVTTQIKFGVEHHPALNQWRVILQVIRSTGQVEDLAGDWTADYAQALQALEETKQGVVKLATEHGAPPPMGIPEHSELTAVFTPEEVESLNAYQKARMFHPFTCGSGRRTDQHHLDGEGLLVATENGWICPYCDYKQDWAHTWMKDGSWQVSSQQMAHTMHLMSTAKPEIEKPE